MYRKKRIKLYFAVIFLLIGTVITYGDVVTFQIQIKPSEIAAGGEGSVFIQYQIADGYHISDAANGFFEVVPEPLKGFEFREPISPEPEEHEYGNYYSGTIHVEVPFKVKSSSPTGPAVLSFNVTVQPCSEEGGICYPPESHELSGRVEILPGQAESDIIQPSSKNITDRFSRALEQGSILAFLFVFLGGVLTSLTPCVYPMIPITVAVIGAQASGGRLKGFVLSLFYVLGLAVTFSTLGFIAARTGALFGAFSQHPAVILIIVSIFFFMGLSLLGVYVIQMPPSLATRLRGRKRSGFLGAFLTGLLAGLVASPCISPILVVILTWVAKSGSAFLGVGLLFTFALGLGVLFVLIGTFSGILKNLPKSGGWMEIVERGFGILLVVLAIVFIRPILSVFTYQMVWAFFLIIFGTFIGAFTPMEKESAAKYKLGKALGVVAILIGACFIFFSLAQKSGWQPGPTIAEKHEELIKWIPDDVEGFRQAGIEKMPLLIDFYAEWCKTCKELDEKTWPDPAVLPLLNQYILVKLDLTKNDEATRIYKERYNVIGPPTVILFDVNQNEIDRFAGFKTPESVIPFLQQGL